MNKRKLLQKIISRPNNVRFSEFVTLAEAFGFILSRCRGSHHIYTHPDIHDLVNIQDVKGQAKPYQIGQFLDLVELYDLKLGD